MIHETAIKIDGRESRAEDTDQYQPLNLLPKGPCSCRAEFWTIFEKM